MKSLQLPRLTPPVLQPRQAGTDTEREPCKRSGQKVPWQQWAILRGCRHSEGQITQHITGVPAARVCVCDRWTFRAMWTDTVTHTCVLPSNQHCFYSEQFRQWTSLKALAAEDQMSHNFNFFGGWWDTLFLLITGVQLSFILLFSSLPNKELLLSSATYSLNPMTCQGPTSWKIQCFVTIMCL